MKNIGRYIAIIVFVEIILGIALAHVFRNVTAAEHLPKLISLLGLGLDFIGVVLVSDSFLKINERYIKIQELVLAGVLGLPLMLAVGGSQHGLYSIIFELNYSLLWAKAIGIVSLYIGCTLFALDAAIDGIGFGIMQNIKTRSSFYGWFLLLSGLVMQMYSVILQIR